MCVPAGFRSDINVFIRSEPVVQFPSV